MIERSEYRGYLKPKLSEKALEETLVKVRENIEKLKETKELLTLCIYRHENMLFMYMESLKELKPQEILKELSLFMEMIPQENGLTPWAKMYHIYHHSVPVDVSEWVKERAANEKRIGRIAFLKEEKLFSYTYWHYAIVQEGLLKGDKYQYISLHENVLFSYFEEPRTNVNITGKEEESKVIEGWLAVDPESHFDREKTKKSNFLVIEPILQI